MAASWTNGTWFISWLLQAERHSKKRHVMDKPRKAIIKQECRKITATSVHSTSSVDDSSGDAFDVKE